MITIRQQLEILREINGNILCIWVIRHVSIVLQLAPLPFQIDNEQVKIIHPPTTIRQTNSTINIWIENNISTATRRVVPAPLLQELIGPKAEKTSI